MAAALSRSPVRDTISEALARDRLRVRDIVGFILSAVAPLTVAAGVITTAYAVTELEGIPAAFLVVALVLAVFSVGFVAMARRITNAGAFYAYAAQGISRPAGVGTALVAVVAYNLLQLGLYGAFGFGLAEYLTATAGVTVPWWLCALLGWAVTAVVGQLWVDFNGRLLALAVAAEIVVVVALTVAGVLHPAAGGLSVGGLSPATLTAGGVGAALVIAVLGFVGLEGSAVYAEESRDPRRTVRVATFSTLAVMAVVYVGVSWALAVHHGPDQVVARSGELGSEALFVMGPGWLGAAGRLLFLTSLFAALLSFHNAVGRYMFALGRERLLPRVFARTNRRTGAPWVASVAQSVLGLVVIVVYAVNGWDPLVQLFFWLGTTGGFGVLILYAITSASVWGFFHRDRDRETLWRRRIAPGMALVALSVMVVLAVANYSGLLGVADGAAVAWVLPAVYPVVFAVGLGYGLWLMSWRPDVYAGIGLGANAATGRASVTPSSRSGSGVGAGLWS